MPAAEENVQHIDFTSLRDILTIVFKHKYKILVTFLIVFAAALAFASQIRSTYEAKSVLLIKLGREFYNRPEGATGGSSVPLDSIVRGEISILNSQDLSNKVVRSIGPLVLYPELAKVPAGPAREGSAVSKFSQALTTTPIGGSLIEVRFTNGNRKVAAQATNTLVDAFKDKHLDVFGGKSTEFLESQKQVFEQRLRESESKLAGFKARNGIFSPQEQKAALAMQRATVDTSLKEAQAKIGELEQNLALIRGPKWVVEMPAETRTELATLRQRERDLLEKHTENSKTVQNVRQQIKEVEDSVKKDAEGLRQKDIAKAEGDLKVAVSKAEGLKRQLSQIDGTINSLESRGVQLQDLNREVAQEEQNYQTYARKLEESLISDDMDRRKMVAISVIEKAAVPMGPKKKRFGKQQIAVGGFFGGIAAGVVLALLLEFLTPVMTTPMSAQKRLGLPVLVAIGRKG
jgi:polysaccharide biosynthesis protein PslE